MSAKLERIVDRKVNILLVTGKKIAISAQEAWGVFFRLDSAIFIMAAFGLVTFLYPIATGISIPWWMKLAGFSIFPVMIPLIYFFQVTALAYLYSYFPRITVFEPALLLVTTFVIEVINHTVNPHLFGQEWVRWLHTASFGEQVTSTYIILFSLDIMYCYFVLPRLQKEASSTTKEPARSEVDAVTVPQPEIAQLEGGNIDDTEPFFSPLEAPQDSHRREPLDAVELDGQKIAISKIVAILAEEHYVRVWTEEREVYGRHSFGRLISRIDEAKGFSPRRGVWLSFKNVRNIQRYEGGKYLITPINGPETIVPRAKAQEVTKLMQSCLEPVE